MWINVQTAWANCGGSRDHCIWVMAFLLSLLFSFLYFFGSELRTGVEKAGGFISVCTVSAYNISVSPRT